MSRILTPRRDLILPSRFRQQQGGFIMNPFASDGGGMPFENVVGLLHLDSDFSDSSLSAHSVTPSGGAVSISSVQSKFGGASALFSGGYLPLPTSSDWAFGTGDFTIEGWVYLTGQGSSIFNCQSTVNLLNLYHDTSTSCRLIVTNNNRIGSIVTPASTWTHLAIVRSGTIVKVYVDGTPAAASYAIGAASMGASNNNNIGGFSGGHRMAGNIDEWRVTKGTAVYTSAFTPPVAAFPNS